MEQDIKRLINGIQKASKAFEQAQTEMQRRLNILQSELNKLRILLRRKEIEIIDMHQEKK